MITHASDNAGRQKQRLKQHNRVQGFARDFEAYELQIENSDYQTALQTLIGLYQKTNLYTPADRKARREAQGKLAELAAHCQTQQAWSIAASSWECLLIIEPHAEVGQHMLAAALQANNARAYIHHTLVFLDGVEGASLTSEQRAHFINARREILTDKNVDDIQYLQLVKKIRSHSEVLGDLAVLTDAEQAVLDIKIKTQMSQLIQAQGLFEVQCNSPDYTYKMLLAESKELREKIKLATELGFREPDFSYEMPERLQPVINVVELQSIVESVVASLSRASLGLNVPGSDCYKAEKIKATWDDLLKTGLQEKAVCSLDDVLAQKATNGYTLPEALMYGFFRSRGIDEVAFKKFVSELNQHAEGLGDIVRAGFQQEQACGHKQSVKYRKLA